MAKWATRQFKSKGEVDRAGRVLVENNVSKTERAAALSAINNWRAIHGYPLHLFTKTLKRRAHQVDGNAVIAQRLKRLHSITVKLRLPRNKNMKLSQMQDIGGCRAIMPSMYQVRLMVEQYERAIAKNPSHKKGKQLELGGIAPPVVKEEKVPTRTEFVERYDYIKEPKPDGYRSFHYVFRYRTTSDEKKDYDGLRIEIQIRSKLQHIWATAVEAVGTFTETAIKSGFGDIRWKRFFALMGTVIALREGCPPVPDTPTDERALVHELRTLYDDLQVEMVLAGISATVELVGAEPTAQAYLLVLDADRKTLEIRSFKQNEMEMASQEYLLVEEKYSDNPRVQAVLVSVDSLAMLPSAYPSFHLDTREFLELVQSVVAIGKVMGDNEKNSRENVA